MCCTQLTTCSVVFEIEGQQHPANVSHHMFIPSVVLMSGQSFLYPEYCRNSNERLKKHSSFMLHEPQGTQWQIYSDWCSCSREDELIF